ncbi:MAG: NUDIX domain-containing protein [Lactobacillus sp.]|jgi:8-oxo-dGTP diphosphatase|nr:NUDIX domain-containing protein [Lactobacillus sp.]
MKKIFFAQKALIVKNNKLLMVRKSKNEHPNPLKWDLPGGRMEWGEGIDESLSRELYEEAGIEATLGKPYYMREWFVTRTQEDGSPLEMQIVAVYRACSTSNDAITNKKATEEEQIEVVEWVSIDEILNLDLMPALSGVIEDFIKDFKAGKIEFPN